MMQVAEKVVVQASDSSQADLGGALSWSELSCAAGKSAVIGGLWGDEKHLFQSGSSVLSDRIEGGHKKNCTYGRDKVI